VSGTGAGRHASSLARCILCLYSQFAACSSPQKT
jgi:hypothetical protein